MNRFKVNDHELVKNIARAINYRRKEFCLIVRDRVTLSDVNWSGGSRSIYTAIDLANLTSRTANLSRLPPWNNPAEGATVEIPPNVAIAQHGTFMGKPATLYLHVRPDNVRALGVNYE